MAVAWCHTAAVRRDVMLAADAPCTVHHNCKPRTHPNAARAACECRAVGRRRYYKKKTMYRGPCNAPQYFLARLRTTA